jgi:hypothetical protein
MSPVGCRNPLHAQPILADVAHDALPSRMMRAVPGGRAQAQAGPARSFAGSFPRGSGAAGAPRSGSLLKEAALRRVGIRAARTRGKVAVVIIDMFVSRGSRRRGVVHRACHRAGVPLAPMFVTAYHPRSDGF